MINPNLTIYDVYLVSVNPNSEIDLGDTKSDNIKKAILENKLYILSKIMVQQSLNVDRFREIITGREFQSTIVYTKGEYRKWNPYRFSNGRIDDSLFIKPVFYKNLESMFNYRGKLYHRLFCKANCDSLSDYLKKYHNREEFLEKLNGLSDMAYENYQKLVENSLDNDSMKIKRLIRDYNLKND